MSHAFLFTAKSSNSKVGPIPVTTTDRNSCPDCPFAANGCYADQQPLRGLWDGLTAAGPNATYQSGKATIHTYDLAGLVGKIEGLKLGQAWRHNQGGDLPKGMQGIDRVAVMAIANANVGKKGWTYTHHNVLQNEHNRTVVADANAKGFTINLSGNTLAHADQLADLAIAPVVVVLPASVQGKAEIHTPKGRRVVVCPATYDDKVNCKSCMLCQKQRNTIVGFPAHGASKAKASQIAQS
jgi:hypothetical protein